LAVSRWRELGGRVLTSTFTVQHTSTMSLGQVLGLVGEGYRSFSEGKGYQLLKQRYGIRGTIRSLEIPYGRHGWHPHLHV
jgi:hypothetical protein